MNIQYRVNASFGSIDRPIVPAAGRSEPDVRATAPPCGEITLVVSQVGATPTSPDRVATDESEHDDEHQRNGCRKITAEGLREIERRLALLMASTPSVGLYRGCCRGVHLIGPPAMSGERQEHVFQIGFFTSRGRRKPLATTDRSAGPGYRAR